ncbi:MAG: insulinase family protein, partial [Deltaproteobacteria bacterium]|nr:insulinase family protein [Deltaproteobacteria bacterium]
AVFEQHDAELDIIAKVLGENENSRLYKVLVKEKKIASEVAAYQSSGQIAGYLLITATLYPDKKTDEARSLILKEIEKIARDGITKDELEQAKNYFRSDFIRSLKRLGGFGGITDRMNYYYQMTGNPNMFEYDLSRYIKASLSSVKAAAKKHLNENYAEVIVLPEKNLSSSSDDFDRSKMPQEKQSRDLKFPEAIKIKTNKGYNLFVMPYQRLPLSYISIIIPAGFSKDGKRKGIANFTSNMLLTGTKRLSGEEIQSKLDILGSTISVNTDADTTTILATFLNDKADATLSLLSEILFEPSFDNKEIEILRSRYQNTLLRMSDQLQFVAAAAATKQYFKNHPYGNLSIGDIDFLKSVNRDEISDFYNRNILSSVPQFAYSGSLKTEDVRKLIEKYLEGFKSDKETKAPDIERKDRPKGIKIFIADKPNTTQSHIIFTFRGIMRKESGFESAYVANTILGGYFLSRLNMRLREEKGFTYGARSNIKFYLRDSIWTISTSVQADATRDTIKETLKVISEMKKTELLSNEEISRAKGYVVKRFPIEFETIDNLHSKLTNIAIFELPCDAINQEYNKLKNITKEEIMKIVTDYFDSENLIIVVAGDKNKILSGLK